MHDYYARKLSAQRLKRVYEISPPRVKRYLDAEIEFLWKRLGSKEWILELGCGYGRILERLSLKCVNLWGIDTSEDSLRMASEILGKDLRGRLMAMNAVQLGFKAKTFDRLLCMQNGISAFNVDPNELVREALRVIRPGGSAIFSSYAEAFWEPRLEWFRLQAAHGLIGEIDEHATGQGVIVCKDGFRATTIFPQDFRQLAERVGAPAKITILEESSVICEIAVH